MTTSEFVNIYEPILTTEFCEWLYRWLNYSAWKPYKESDAIARSNTVYNYISTIIKDDNKDTHNTLILDLFRACGRACDAYSSQMYSYSVIMERSGIDDQFLLIGFKTKYIDSTETYQSYDKFKLDDTPLLVMLRCAKAIYNNFN